MQDSYMEIIYQRWKQDYDAMSDIKHWLDAKSEGIAEARLDGIPEEEIDEMLFEAATIADKADIPHKILGIAAVRLESLGMDDEAHDIRLRYENICVNHDAIPEYPKLMDLIVVSPELRGNCDFEF